MLNLFFNPAFHLAIVSLLFCTHLKASDSKESPDLTASSLTAQVEAPTQIEDKFNFLSTKFPQLLIQAQESFKQCSEEARHYQKLTQLTVSQNKSPEQVLLDGAKDVLEKKIMHFFGPEYEQFVLDQIQPMIVKLEENHPKNGYFNTFFSRALTNHTVLENLLLAAEYIFQVVKDEGGGTVIFLGRTPCLVQVPYEELLGIETDKTQTSVHLNFSGHPDALTKRESSFFRSDTNKIRDMVTPEKLRHYFSYLDTKKIQNAKALFVVDILGSGSSLNSFLRIMNAYYHQKETQMPMLTYLCLTQDFNWSMDRSECYTFKRTGEVSNRGILTLPEDPDKNMKGFQIPACGIPIFDKTLTDMLDQDMFQEFLIHGIQYPAQKWTSEFDEQRAQGGQYHVPLYEYLRPNFLHLIQSHQGYDG